MSMYLILVLAAVAAAVPLEPKESEMVNDRVEIEAVPSDEISKDKDMPPVPRLRTDPFIIQKGRGELLKVPTTFDHVPLVTEFTVPITKFGLPRSDVSSPAGLTLLRSPSYLGGPTFVFSGSDGSGINPSLLQPTPEGSPKPGVSQITVINNPLFPQFALIAGGSVLAQPFPEFIYERPKEEKPSRPMHPHQEMPIPPQPEKPTHEIPKPSEPLPPQRPVAPKPGVIKDSDYYSTSHGPQVPIPGVTHVQGGYSFYDYPSLPVTFGTDPYRPFPTPYLAGFVLVTPDGKPLEKPTAELPKPEEVEVKPIPGILQPLVLP